MRVRYDRAGNSIVIVCECGYQDVGIDQVAAWSLAGDHESRAHPESWHVRNAASHRHAYQNRPQGGKPGEGRA